MLEYTEKSGKAIRCYMVDGDAKRKAVLSCIRKRKEALVILAIETKGEKKPRLSIYKKAYANGKKLLFEELMREDECNVLSEEISKESKDNT